MYHAFRLIKGNDLKQEIEKYVIANNIKAGVILCCVGCVYEINIRLANGKDIFQKKGNYEIVSITGTLSMDGVHLHGSFSGTNGETIGGHLKEGCLINTTAEICLLEINDLKFTRIYDEMTGFKELDIKKV
jgi:uncharacterized protein